VSTRIVGVLALAALASRAEAQDLEPILRRTRWRVTAERMEDDDRDSSLVGAHFDLLDPWRAVPGSYLGLGGFAAVEGDTGGFLAGGATIGYVRDVLGGLAIDTGIFAGLGGGGRLDFDGFVYRPHVALQHPLGPVDLRVELAYFDAPDADFEDLHLAVGLSLPAELLLVREVQGRRNDIAEDAIVEHRIRTTPTWLHLEPDSDAARRSDASRIRDVEMLGQSFDYFTSEHTFLTAEVYGASGGDVPGFVLAMAGVGFSLPVVGPRVRLEGKGLVGAGGGGDVDTGGGFAWQGMGGLAIELFGGFGLQAMVGRTGFPDGEFDATTTAAGLSWNVRAAEVAWDHPRTALENERLPDDVFRESRTRIDLVHKFQQPRSGARELDGTPLEDFELVGLSLEHRVIEDFSLTLSGYGGYGDVGGYAEGLLGVRYERRLALDSPHAFSVLGEIGAAGGGDVDVGSGLIYAGSVGYRYRIAERVHLLAEYGFTKSDNGPYEANHTKVGIGWSIARPAYR